MNRRKAIHQPRGFTLTEMMIAVAIIGILAAFLAPSVSRYMHRNKGRSAANDVASVLLMARNQAMGTGQVVFVEVDPSGDHGSVSMYRKQPNDCASATPSAACFSQSCAEANSFPDTSKVVTPTPKADLAQRHPDMKISGHNAAGVATTTDATLTLCFTPDGRVLDALGLPLTATCGGVNARIFVQATDPGDTTNELGGESLDKCLTVGVNNATEARARQLQKDGRDIANFFDIQIPYNGAISVVQ